MLEKKSDESEEKVIDIFVGVMLKRNLLTKFDVILSFSGVHVHAI